MSILVLKVSRIVILLFICTNFIPFYIKKKKKSAESYHTDIDMNTEMRLGRELFNEIAKCYLSNLLS